MKQKKWETGWAVSCLLAQQRIWGDFSRSLEWDFTAAWKGGRQQPLCCHLQRSELWQATWFFAVQNWGQPLSTSGVARIELQTPTYYEENQHTMQGQQQYKRDQSAEQLGHRVEGNRNWKLSEKMVVVVIGDVPRAAEVRPRSFWWSWRKRNWPLDGCVFIRKRQKVIEIERKVKIWKRPAWW